MAPPRTSDREPVRACGDVGVEDLFRTHRDRLWSVAVRMLGSPSDAEDAVQETFVSALRGGRFRGEADPGTWLHRILVNKCIDRMRTLRSVPTQAPVPSAPDPTGGVATRLVLGEALALLPPGQRAAVVLVDVQGYAVAEAAAILDVPPGTVKSRCARARVTLAELLGHLREEP